MPTKVYGGHLEDFLDSHLLMKPAGGLGLAEHSLTGSPGVLIDHDGEKLRCGCQGM